MGTLRLQTTGARDIEAAPRVSATHLTGSIPHSTVQRQGRGTFTRPLGPGLLSHARPSRSPSSWFGTRGSGAASSGWATSPRCQALLRTNAELSLDTCECSRHQRPGVPSYSAETSWLWRGRCPARGSAFVEPSGRNLCGPVSPAGRSSRCCRLPSAASSTSRASAHRRASTLIHRPASLRLGRQWPMR